MGTAIADNLNESLSTESHQDLEELKANHLDYIQYLQQTKQNNEEIELDCSILRSKLLPHSPTIATISYKLIIEHIFQPFIIFDFSNTKEEFGVLYKLLYKLLYGYFTSSSSTTIKQEEEREVYLIFVNFKFKNIKQFETLLPYVPRKMRYLSFKEYEILPFEHIKRFSFLKGIVHVKFTNDEQIKKFKESKENLKGLEVLRIGIVVQGEESIKKIMEVCDRINTLRFLFFKNFSMFKEFGVRLKLRRLRQFGIFNWRNVVCKFQFFPRLQTLKLVFVKILKEQVKAICDLQLLRNIDMDFCDFTEALNFHKLFFLPNLRVINASNCKVEWKEFNIQIRNRKITSKQLKVLDMKMEYFRFVNIQNTPRTFFKRLRHLHSLKYLYLIQCFENFDEGILRSYLKTGKWNDIQIIFKDENGDFPEGVSIHLFTELISDCNEDQFQYVRKSGSSRQQFSITEFMS